MDAGFHKLLKDQLKRIWARTQNRNNLTEKQKRQRIIEILKETHERMSMNDNSVFWKKAGLECPLPLQTDDIQMTHK